MTDVSMLARQIEQGPQGRHLAAFFGLDGALMAGTAGSAYKRAGSVNLAEWAGRPLTELEHFAAEVFRAQIAGQLYPETRALVRAHRKAGHPVVLVTSETDVQARPVAADFGIEHVLASRLGTGNGTLTGRLEGGPLLGERLTAALRDFAARHDINLSESYGYAHAERHLPVLESVGYPYCVNPGHRLQQLAVAHSWPSLRLDSRGRPTVEQVLRTGGALAGVGAAAAIGVGSGLLRGSRRKGTNAAASVGTRVVLGLAGVKLNVVGREHLETRPAVVVFNHQSTLDMFIVAAVLRRDMTAVAKKELAKDPSFAVFGYLADVAYIDRADSAQAKEALKPAVDRLRSGISIAIAPEGTRSPTPTLALFKKGAFHLAMQAQVPILPIVIRNAGDIIWSKSYLVRPGTVDVAVLPPVPTDGWRVPDLGEHVSAIHDRFVETLEQWPGDR
jgi:putative phosphoserine phosphatase/1-acylglycerol-3-phosphate O-acyltransferase